MNGLALCAGVGGLELGLKLALGDGYRTVGYVEREAYAASVLVARMADAALDEAPIWDDLTSFDGRPWRGRVDLVTSGLPCQPYSVAGKQRGHDDERALWPHFVRVPGVKRYMDDTREQAKAQGFVETWFGRRLWLPEINGANGPRRQAAERAAINAPMQGTAADLIKLAMLAVQRWLESSHMHSKLIMQVHDELVLEVPDSELATVKHELPRLMAQVAQISVPLVAEVGVGKNWEEAH